MTSVLQDLKNWLTDQDLDGIVGVHTFFVPQDKTGSMNLPALEIKRNGGDKYPDLSYGNSDSLASTDFTIDCVAANALDAMNGAEAVIAFLDDGTNYPATMGTRTAFTAITGSPEDDVDPPPDASDNWVPRVHIPVTIQHSPA